MPKRESYDSTFECPLCGKKGTATWEENENPVYGGGFNRKLEDLDAGFHQRGGSGSEDKVEIICDDCKVPVSS